ncbi:hypothetical protein [Nocardia panacis]|uniref:hypothetical protein n=1 Tax=Nocardia panacis TaxID=2340916 RepID=UPI001396C747|nr:hypothetical protein [Nocardia panacis]
MGSSQQRADISSKLPGPLTAQLSVDLDRFFDGGGVCFVLAEFRQLDREVVGVAGEVWEVGGGSRVGKSSNSTAAGSSSRAANGIIPRNRLSASTFGV